MKKLLFSLILFLCLGATGWGQTTYYSKGSLAVNTAANWNTARDGLGTNASAFGTNNTWVIQNGHSMTLSGATTWNVGASGIVIIENGGTWTSSSSGAVTINTFKIYGGGTFIHNTGAATVYGTTRQFANSTNGSNGNGTYEIQGYGTSGITTGITWGNVRVNRATTTQAVGHSSAFKTVEGNFVMDAHGTHEFRFTAAQTDIHTISGNIVINGGLLNLKSGAGALTVNIGGNLTIAGGTFTQTSGTSTINFTGSSKTFTFSSGTLTTTLMSFDVNSGATLTLINDLPVASSRTATVNGTLDCVNQVVSGAGAFTLSSTGVLKTSNNSGIDGSITVSGTKTFNPTGSYEFKGTADQVTGALLTNAKNIVLANTAGKVSLSGNIAITGTLSIPTGNILDAASNVISGGGDIDLQGGGTFITAHTSGLNGNNTTSGGLSSYSTTANYTFNGSSAQVTGAYLPATVNNLTIDNAAGVTLSNSALTVSGTMTINSGKLFTLESGKQLTVASLTNNATAGLVLQSPATSGAPGSLIVDGSISGSGTLKLERYVAAYTGPSDGWHILSSPVNNFTIAGSTFEPGSVDPNIDDLYWYDEATNFWKNYKVGGNFSSFTNGYGYLCSYQTAATKYFTGTPNNSDITFSDLTLTSTRGWHAIGNPFQSALKWNDGNWTLTNVNTTAKLLNSGGTYSNLVANDIIPAAQGVFVQVTDATNTITIPKAARTHNTASWNKSGNEILARLRFTADSETDNTYVETDFLFDSQASTTVDERNDGFFLQGIEAAPQMFLKIDDQNLSLKRLPSINGVYNLQFIKGLSSNYSFSMSGMESLPENIIVTLTDTKTNQSQVLTENPVYTFTSETTDSPDRFLVVFGVVGIGENNPDLSLQAYVHGNQLYVMNTNGKATLQLFDLQGRLFQSYLLNGIGMQSRPINLPSGVYVVRLSDNVSVKSVKVVIE
jgi:hypothetical protein